MRWRANPFQYPDGVSSWDNRTAILPKWAWDGGNGSVVEEGCRMDYEKLWKVLKTVASIETDLGCITQGDLYRLMTYMERFTAEGPR